MGTNYYLMKCCHKIHIGKLSSTRYCSECDRSYQKTTYCDKCLNECQSTQLFIWAINPIFFLFNDEYNSPVVDEYKQEMSHSEFVEIIKKIKAHDYKSVGKEFS
jgi:hypothetical protein